MKHARTDAILVAVLAALAALLEATAVDEGCLSCLCQAATGCDAGRGCDGATCGMFAISRQYWQDAGQPSGDFETCALDPACATQCVRAYLQRFSRDCDGDGAVGCADHCRLHRLGREGCGGGLDAEFAGRLDSCNASVPLGHFYARRGQAAPATARPAPRQRSLWNGGGGYTNGAPQQSSGGSPSYSFSPSLSVSVNPTYRGGGSSGGTPGSQYPAGANGYQQGTRGYQSGGGGYNSVAGYQTGGYQTGGYQTGGYQTGGYQGGGYEEGGSFSSARRRVGGSGAYVGQAGYGQSLSGWTGSYGQQEGGVLWGAGEGYRPYSGGTSAAPVSPSCLSCICNALTGCDVYAGCSNGGCGPFKISLPYWQDCGSPGQSYEYCSRDYACSSGCVRRYLAKYAQDCTGDGVVDCRDYARIHRLGGFGCRGALDGAYRGRVDACPAY